MTYTSPLDQVRVAAPCPADWGRMVGDERVRFCDQCRLKVYNLSGMSKREAEALVTNSEGRLCVRFYRRGDGTILTENCPTGLRAIKRRARRVAGSVASAVLGFLAGVGLNFGFGTDGQRAAPFRGRTMGVMVREPLRVSAPVEPVLGRVMPQPAPREYRGWSSGVMVNNDDLKGQPGPAYGTNDDRAGGDTVKSKRPRR